MQNHTKPSERDRWFIDASQFVAGPDTYIKSKCEGWNIYLCEDLPIRNIYALCRYEFNRENEEQIVHIGSVDIDGCITRENVNEKFRSVGVEPVSEAQWDILKEAYDEQLRVVFRNEILNKSFTVAENTMYFESDCWPRALHNSIEETHENYERHCSYESDDNARVEPDEDILELEPLSEDQMNNLNVIAGAVELQHSDEITHVKHAQYAGKLSFSNLEPPYLRAIELVHSGVFKDHRMTALIHALLESGYTKEEVADETGKSVETVDKHVGMAKDLTRRANWNAEHVPVTDTV